MNMKYLELLIKAYCSDCDWSNAAAGLLGKKWDEEGCALRSWVTSYFAVTYGDQSIDWLNAFQDKGVLEYWQYGQKYTINSARELAYFLEEVPVPRYVEA